MSNLLEGINEKSTKAELLERLRTGAKEIAGFSDERVKRMIEIETQLRSQMNPVALRKVIVSATKEEWAETVDFLENFQDYLPSTLARVLEGAKEVGRAAP